MYTDPTRLRATDPGHVEGNPVFEYHDAFNDNKEEVQELKTRYEKGRVGDVEVKESLAKALNHFLDPIRTRRAYFEEHHDDVLEALRDGTRRAQVIAESTMEEVRSAMGINSYTG